MRKVIKRKRLHTWGTPVGICCFLAGIVAPLLGGFFTAIDWIGGNAVPPWMHTAGTVLFIVGIPLILFAGFCLDWAEDGQKKAGHDPKGSQRGVATPGQIATILHSSRHSSAGVHRASRATHHLQPTEQRSSRSRQGLL